MGEYAITFARSARKELERLPDQIVDRVFDKIGLLARNPRPSASTKLKGAENLWRIRVGDYRVVYEIDDEKQTVDVAIVRHRKEVYRDL